MHISGFGQKSKKKANLVLDLLLIYFDKVRETVD
jgi:hypothetical protein